MRYSFMSSCSSYAVIIVSRSSGVIGGISVSCSCSSGGVVVMVVNTRICILFGFRCVCVF